MMARIMLVVLVFLQVVTGLTNGHAAGLVQPVANKWYRGDLTVEVQTWSSIIQIDLYRAYPQEPFDLYRVYAPSEESNIFVISQEDITCGEYIMVVYLADGDMAFSGIFTVLTWTPMIEFVYPNEFSGAGPGDLVLIKVKFFGDNFTPQTNFVFFCVTAPKSEDDCEGPLLIMQRFGSDMAKWLVPANPTEGFYTITAVQADNTNNFAKTVVYIDPHPTITPHLTLSKSFWMVKDEYLLHIGRGSQRLWALQYSYNGKNWYELYDLFLPGETITVTSTADMIFFRLRQN